MRKCNIYYNIYSYNRMMLRPLAVIPLMALLLTGCGESDKTKEKVQQAIVGHLQATSGLDLNALDFNTTSITFDKNFAYAAVAFHPKNDENLNDGMTMTYTLQDRNGKWVVIKVGDGQGHGTRAGMAPGSKGDENELPPGHPPVPSSDPHTKMSGQQGAVGQLQ
jgi:hypothetical protein